jgi:hypothetical protein
LRVSGNRPVSARSAKIKVFMGCFLNRHRGRK